MVTFDRHIIVANFLNNNCTFNESSHVNKKKFKTMLVLLSPSKTMDFQDNWELEEASYPQFLDEAEELVKQLRQYSPEEIGELMNVSDKIAKLNFDRFQSFSTPFNNENARQAILAYRGDVYDGIAVNQYTEKDFQFAQEQVRILTGLYGILRPLDLIQPYRLEMGTRFPNPKGDNLYEFWGNKITENINNDLRSHNKQYVVNLASNEYFKAINSKQLKGNVITPVFKENKNGQYKTIAIYAKKARGYMTDFIVRNRIDAPEDLKGFNYDGYGFNEDLSNDKEFVFTRG